MRTAPMGPSNGMPGEHEGGAGGVDGQHVVGVLLVGAEDGDDDLGLVAVALGEAGAQRAVDQPGGQDGRVGRPALPAEERPGDLAGGVHPLFDVDGEREEVDALPDARMRRWRWPGRRCRRAGRRRRPGTAGPARPVSKDRVSTVPLTGADTLVGVGIGRLAAMWHAPFGARSTRAVGAAVGPVPSRRPLARAPGTWAWGSSTGS